MMLTVPYLVVFIGGLGVAVYSMLQGVTPAPATRKIDRGLLRSAPSIAGFAVIFGALGYLCGAHTSLNPGIVLLIATLAGGLSLSLTAPMLLRLSARLRAQPAAEPEVEGQLAKVLKPITNDAPGEIEFEIEGRPVRQPALSVAGALIPGQDVVIERIDGGIAYVEDWRTVEQRL